MSMKMYYKIIIAPINMKHELPLYLLLSLHDYMNNDWVIES